MKPYYRDDWVRLYHTRWEILLPLLGQQIVRAVITDSPYGLTQLPWDVQPHWWKFWANVYRVCTRDAVQVLFSQQPFTTDLINSNRARWWYELIWDKTMPTGFLDANRRPLRAHENIQIFAQAPNSTTYNPQKTKIKPERDHSFASSKTPAAHYGQQRANFNTELKTDRYPRSVVPFSNGHGGKSDHETAKSLELMMWLVATYTNPGDLVLDPFVGKGTTAEACKRLGRYCIGIEMREQPLQVAARTLRQEAMELAS